MKVLLNNKYIGDADERDKIVVALKNYAVNSYWDQVDKAISYNAMEIECCVKLASELGLGNLPALTDENTQLENDYYLVNLGSQSYMGPSEFDYYHGGHT